MTIINEVFSFSQLLKDQERDNDIIKNWRQWLHEFVGVGNDLLNRAGAICPCIPKALRDDQVYVSIIDFLKCYDINTISKCIFEYIEWFLAHIKNKTLEEKAIISLSLLFPENVINLMEVSIVDIHSFLKPILISKGIMLGEFMPDYKKSSIRNHSLYPLNSPVHALVIRNISHHDKKFVIADSKLTPEQKEMCLDHIKKFTNKN